MAEKFSIDDILNEYSSNTNASKNQIDSLLKQVSSNKDKSIKENVDKKQNEDNFKKPREPISQNLHSEKTKVIENLDIKAEDKPIIAPESLENAPPQEVEKSRKTHKNFDFTNTLKSMKKEKTVKTVRFPSISNKKVVELNPSLNKKILPNTTNFTINADTSDEEKLRILEEQRKSKVSSFFMTQDNEDNKSNEAEKSEQNGPADFESFEDAPLISSEIKSLKKTLSIRTALLLILTLLSSYIALANDYNLPIPSFMEKSVQSTGYVFALLIIGIISSIVCSPVLVSGISKLFTLKADCDSLVATSTIVTLISTAFTLFNTSLIELGIIHIFIPISVAGLLFNTIGKNLIINRADRNFNFICGDFEKNAVCLVENEEKAENFTRGTLHDFPVLATMKKTEFLSDFLKYTYSTDIVDKFSKFAAPISFGISIIITIICYILNIERFAELNYMVALSVFSLCLSFSSGFTSLIIVNLPLAKASKKYLESSAVILGYQSIDTFSDTNSIMIDAAKLFPQGMINLSGIKVFSDTKIDDAIIEAASLTSHAGSILKYMFYDVIVGKTEMLHPVENYIYEDSMGLCGWINNKRVLIGNRELMKNHSIEGLPTKTKEHEYTEGSKEAIYLSISGNLSAMFIVEMNANIETKRWMQELHKNEISVVLRSVDSIISLSKLSVLFNIPQEMLKILPFRMHSDFNTVTEYTPKHSASMACSGGFTALSQLLVGARKIRHTAIGGIILQSSCALLGIILSIIAICTGSIQYFNASMVLFYNLAWTIIITTIVGTKRI